MWTRLPKKCIPHLCLEDISRVRTRRKCKLQHDSRLLRLDETSANSRVSSWSNLAWRNHSDVDSHMTNDGLEAGSTVNGLLDSGTPVRGRDDHSLDVGKVGGKVNDTGVGLLVSGISIGFSDGVSNLPVDDINSGQGGKSSDIEGDLV